MRNSYEKLAFNIYSRNSNINQLANEEVIKGSLGLAGLAGGYEASRLIDHMYNPLIMKSPILLSGSLGVDIGSTIAKSNLSNRTKALISAGGLAASGLGIGRVGYDIAKKLAGPF
jgi:hypothetical protein